MPLTSQRPVPLADRLTFPATFRRGLLAIAMLGLTGAVPSSPAPGMAYRIRSSTRLPTLAGNRMGDLAPGGSVLLGHAISVGGRVRIELRVAQPGVRNASLEEYLLVSDSGTIVSVNPDSRTYRDGSDLSVGLSGLASTITRATEDFVDEFNDAYDITPVGASAPRDADDAGLGAGALNDFQVGNVQVDVDSLGASEVIEGRPTKHYVVRVSFAAFLERQLRPIKLTIDVWTAQLPMRIPNPFDPFGSGVYGSTGSVERLTSSLAAVSRKLDGVPVKVVSTASLADMFRELTAGATPAVVIQPNTDFDIVQTIVISAIEPVNVDPAQLTLPAGFTKR